MSIGAGAVPGFVAASEHVLLAELLPLAEHVLLAELLLLAELVLLRGHLLFAGSADLTLARRRNAEVFGPVVASRRDREDRPGARLVRDALPFAFYRRARLVPPRRRRM